MELGVGILSHNRPHYLKQVLDSLEKQQGDNRLYLFQDGYNIDNIRLFLNSKSPKKTLCVSDNVLGVAFNSFRAFERLSELHKQFVIVEDDAVLGKDYLKLIRVLLKQFKRDKDVFSVSCGFTRDLSLEYNLDRAYIIKTPLHYYWADAYYARSWERVRPYYIKYLDLIKGVPYKDRPEDKIRRLFGERYSRTTQDACRDWGFISEGMKRVSTVVNRGYYIGKEGLHFNSNVYGKLNYESMKPFEFEGDSKIRKFKING